MKKLETFENAEAPSGDYEFGSIKDDSGLLDGTEMDRNTFSDMFQFFAKMFAESFIISNELPDNTTNGYQLFDAFFSFHKKLNGWFNERVSGDDISTTNTTGLFTMIPNLVFSDGAIFACRNTIPEVTAFNLSTGLAVGAYTAELSNPIKCFVLDPVSEVLFVLDTNHATHRVLTFAMDDGLSVVDKIAVNASAVDPTDIFVLSNRIYVLTKANGVKVYDGTTFALIPGENFGSGDFADGVSLFISHGKAYIADRTTAKVFVYDISTLANLTNEHIGSGVLNDPREVFIIGNKIYVVDFGDSVVYVFDISSKSNLVADFIATDLATPVTLSYDKINNRMFVFDTASNDIVVFKQNLTIDHI